jgi:hypothetical protein
MDIPQWSFSRTNNHSTNSRHKLGDRGSPTQEIQDVIVEVCFDGKAMCPVTGYVGFENGNLGRSLIVKKM